MWLAFSLSLVDGGDMDRCGCGFGFSMVVDQVGRDRRAVEIGVVREF